MQKKRIDKLKDKKLAKFLSKQPDWLLELWEWNPKSRLKNDETVKSDVAKSIPRT